MLTSAHFISSILFFADQGATPPPMPQLADQGFEQTLIMISVAFVFFYFLIMRPENKRRKEMEAKRQAIKKGDKVIVSGGIVAEIYRVHQETVVVKLHDGAKMEVLKVAIQEVKPNLQPIVETEAVSSEGKN